MTIIYDQHKAAFANVSAYVIAALFVLMVLAGTTPPKRRRKR